MAVTQNTYTGDGTTVLFSFTFPYLEATDIKVSVNGTNTTAYTLANATTIQFNAAPTNGAAIRIYRQTDDAALAATFYPGSAIRSSDLNENFTQNLYVTQESSNNAASATTTANTALTNSNTAISTANSAVSTANTASTNASAAVATANTASTNASAAVSTANTASTNATAAVNTANTASTNASNAVTTANTALSTANTASSNASAAVATANTASSNASAAVSTANTASSNATTAVNTANNALSTANAATATANTASTNATAALNAVAGSLQYTLVANVAGIPGSPVNNQAIEIADSTGIESFSPLTNRPAGFVGDSGLSVRLQYLSAGSSWNWLNYFANNSETRYLKFGGGTITGNLEIGNSGSLSFEGSTANAFETTLAVTDPTADRTITLPDVSGTVVTTGDTGSVTSTMIADGTIATGDLADGAVTSAKIADGTIVNADVSASAAIAGTKISPNFGTQPITTTGTLTSDTVTTTGAFQVSRSGSAVGLLSDSGSYISNDLSAGRFIPTGSTVPTNGVYLPAANSVAISTNSTGRLFIDSSGRVLTGTSTARNNFFNNYTPSVPGVQIETASADSNAPLRVFSHTFGNNGVGGPIHIFAKHRGTSLGGSTAVQSGDILGEINFQGGDGSDMVEAAVIKAEVDGTPGANDMPGRLVFSTTSDNSASPTERMRLDSSGRLGIGATTVSDLLHVRGVAPNIRIDGGTSPGTYGVKLYGDATEQVNFTYNNQTGENRIGGVQSYIFPTFFSGGSERARIDTSGRLLVGTSSAQGTSIIQAVGNSSASTDPGDIRVIRGLNVSQIGTNVGAELGIIRFGALENSVCAQISAVCDANWSANDTPGRLVFSTTPDSGSSPVERMRINNSGSVRIGGTGDPGSIHIIQQPGVAVGTQILSIAGSQDSIRVHNASDFANPNGVATVMWIRANNSTSRSINAAGTINASGADYAEYMVKSGDFTIAKGDICGITLEGLLTNKYINAVSFVVKSTNPSYVGGDDWGSDFDDDPDGLEAVRQTVDRIAFAGQVPVNVIGATPGQYIVPVEAADGGIEGVAKNEADLTLAEYMRAVGKVIAIEDDGRARIIVKVA